MLSRPPARLQLLNCIMDMAEKTRRSLTVLRRCQEADREELNHWVRRYSDAEDTKKGPSTTATRPLSSSTGAEGSQLGALGAGGRREWWRERRAAGCMRVPRTEARRAHTPCGIVPNRASLEKEVAFCSAQSHYLTYQEARLSSSGSNTLSWHLGS